MSFTLSINVQRRVGRPPEVYNDLFCLYSVPDYGPHTTGQYVAPPLCRPFLHFLTMVVSSANFTIAVEG